MTSVKEVFSQLLRYFPQGEEGLLRKNLNLFAQACLAAGDFAQAQTYADMLLAQEPDDEQRMSACRVRLYAKLQCRKDKEFVHSPAFSKELPEYLELLNASLSDEQKFKQLIDLANENLRTVAQDRAAEEKRERDEEQRRQEEEKRRQQEKARRIQEEEQRRREEEQRQQEAERLRLFREAENKVLRQMFLFKAIIFGVASLFFLAGIVVWFVFGSDMPYRIPALGWLFAAAVVLYLLSMILPKWFYNKKRG